jgi:hypothetical protein
MKSSFEWTALDCAKDRTNEDEIKALLHGSTGSSVGGEDSCDIMQAGKEHDEYVKFARDIENKEEEELFSSGYNVQEYEMQQQLQRQSNRMQQEQRQQSSRIQQQQHQQHQSINIQQQQQHQSISTSMRDRNVLACARPMTTFDDPEASMPLAYAHVVNTAPSAPPANWHEPYTAGRDHDGSQMTTNRDRDSMGSIKNEEYAEGRSGKMHPLYSDEENAPQIAAVHCLHNRKDEDGLTRLHKAVRDGQLNIVEILLTFEGIAVDAKNNEQCTVLMYACNYDNIEIVEALLAALKKTPNFDINDKDIDGDTALMIACMKKWSNVEIIKLLLAIPRINTNMKSNSGMTALDYAKGNINEDEIKVLFQGELPPFQV